MINGVVFLPFQHLVDYLTTKTNNVIQEKDSKINQLLSEIETLQAEVTEVKLTSNVQPKSGMFNQMVC